MDDNEGDVDTTLNVTTDVTPRKQKTRTTPMTQTKWTQNTAHMGYFTVNSVRNSIVK